MALVFQWHNLRDSDLSQSILKILSPKMFRNLTEIANICIFSSIAQVKKFDLTFSNDVYLLCAI